MAHTCHPAIVSDGIACIAAAYEIFNILNKRKNYYSYELFWTRIFCCSKLLEKDLKNLKNIKYGIFDT